MSRYQSSYDTGESRRSPRDPSPGRYNDRERDEFRGGASRGGERRRSIPDARTSRDTFTSNRDSFRDSAGRDSSRDFPPRDPPRGPKVLTDVPTGPRASSYSSDFRGDFGGYRGDYRGDRGRGRGRGWRDDNRDRGREVDRDYRDRRDDRAIPSSFRDNRGQERWGRDGYRDRRPSSPQGRGRSPSYHSRDNRDAPPSIEIDRSRRESRDGPLSGGSPSAESHPSFARGYGRARGSRGRGRGGYYEEYHRGPGRSRSPDSNWSRRTQPSATPPPQVPAFGSASAASSTNAPVGPDTSGNPATSAGPLPGIAVPTAPRSHVPASRLDRTRNKYSSMKWVNTGLQGKAQDLESPKPDLSGFNDASTESHKESEEDNHKHAVSETVKLETPKTSEEHGPESLSKVEGETSPREFPRIHEPVIVRRPAKPLAPLLSIANDPTDSDSADELDDNYFEEEIEKFKEKIKKVPEENQLILRREPDAFFLKPYHDSAIDGHVHIQKIPPVEECIPPEVASASLPEEASTSTTTILALKPKAKDKSGATSPLPDTADATKPKTSIEDVTAKLEGLVPSSLGEPQTERQDPSLDKVNFQANSSDKVNSGSEETANSTFSAKPITNGNTRKPMMETFDDSEGYLTEAENAESLEAVRKQMKTPPISSLPSFGLKKKWFEDEEFLKSLEPDPIVEERVRKSIQDSKARITREQEEERQKYKQRLYEYRRWTDFSDDPAAVRSREKFAASRAKAAAEAAAPHSSSLPTAGAKPEGQRRTGSRWATEHDFERVLRESEQEAKETKEREERVARAKTASAKEASIPDMCWNEEEWEKTKFIDKTHLVPFERSFAILEYAEPIDNFTPEECEIFEKIYLEYPKQFSKIAEALPRRDYKACIQHYYLAKHETNLKEKLRKQPKRKKGRAAKGTKPKSNALMADLEPEESQDAENGERRRPRRAAAPTFQFETPASESEVASPAPTSGRKSAAPKGDTGSEVAPTGKRKGKAPREKSTKQPKNSQLLAAAPATSARSQPEPPTTPAASRRESGGTPRFPPTQFDGAAQNQPTFAPPYVPVDRPNQPMTVNFDVIPQPTFSAPPNQERVGSAPPIGFDNQQDRRNIQQTSSYWSVPEQTDFPALLKHFGTDWHGIAKWMTSKTHIMVYTTNFQHWLAVPSDSNKSRLVTNIQTQVKNYYQRQVDSGKWREWEEIAREAEEKKARGEDTGPLPQPTVLPKRRYDITPGSIPRSGSAMEVIEDLSTGQSTMLSQSSPQQPTMSARFPALAQAGPVPQIQPATPTSVLNKHLPPQPIQQAPGQTQQQPRPPRGPALGYFNTESPRPIVQPDPAVSQRSLMVAQEAQLERQSALRLVEQSQQQQQQAMQRDRIIQMKQENAEPNLHHYEPYSTSAAHSSNVALARPEPSKPTPAPVEQRRTAPPPQFPPRAHHPVRNLLSDNASGPREIKSSPSPVVPRPPMSAPPPSQELHPHQPPPPPPPQTAPVAAVRPQETVRKTSSIMSLLNDEPSDPRPTPPKRVSDVASSSLQPSRTPPPPQHSMQPARYAPHPSQVNPPAPQQMISQAPSSQQQHQQSQHSYAQPAPHGMHQHSSSIGRSYTPTSFESRVYAPPPIQQQQPPQMYSQPPRPSITSQPPPIRRDQSHGDIHGITSGYTRTSAPTQPRLKESPYSATPPPQASQPVRQQAGSPLDLAPPSDRDYYQRQPQYIVQQQQSAARSPQLGPSYHGQPQPQQPQPTHRQIAFGQSQPHIASPPTQYAKHQLQHPLQRSRHNSFDARYPMATTSAPPQAQQGYIPAPHHQAAPLPMQYQQHPSQERYQQSNFEHDIQIREEAYRLREIEERRRIDESRRLEEQRRMDEHRPF